MRTEVRSRCREPAALCLAEPPPSGAEVLVTGFPGDGPRPEPRARTSSAADGVPRAVRPLVWSLALLWMVIRASGRGLESALRAYDLATSATGRAAVCALRALLGALGPLGRFLRRLLTPLRRGLRRLWREVGLRALLLAFRPLGPPGRWMVKQAYRGAIWVEGRAVNLAARVQPLARALASTARPVLRAFAAGTRAIEGAAARLGALLRRAWAPVSGAAAAVSRAGLLSAPNSRRFIEQDSRVPPSISSERH